MSQANNDCYYYFYSNCTKGDSCPFRHEPHARGSEVMCEDWEFGKCLKKICPKRHMIITVQRSQVACYWENQPGGCQKPHCVFKHQKPRINTAIRKAAVPEPVSTTKSALDVDNIPSPKVDPILITADDTDEEKETPVKAKIVKSTISNEPVKKKMLLTNVNLESRENSNGRNNSKQNAEVKVKTLREIKREKILKARLEHEKKLLAFKKSEGQEQKSNKAAGDAVVSSSMNQSTSTRTGSSAASDSATSLQSQSVGSEPPSKSAGELRVKTFEEIMKEKRKRKLGQADPASFKLSAKSKDLQPRAEKQTAADREHQAAESPTIIIPPRKIRIRKKTEPDNAMNDKSRVKIRRPQISSTTEPDSKVEEQPDNALEENSVNGNNAAKCLSVTTDAAVHDRTTEEPQSTNTPQQTTAENCASRTRSTDDITDLLDESLTSAKTTSLHAEILDDEELMNEMEELLA